MFGLTKLTIKIQDLISFNYMVLLLATLQYQETTLGLLPSSAECFVGGAH